MVVESTYFTQDSQAQKMEIGDFRNFYEKVQQVYQIRETNAFQVEGNQIILRYPLNQNNRFYPFRFCKSGGHPTF